MHEKNQKNSILVYLYQICHNIFDRITIKKEIKHEIHFISHSILPAFP